MRRALRLLGLGGTPALAGGCFLALAAFPPPLPPAVSPADTSPAAAGTVRIGPASGGAALAPASVAAPLAGGLLAGAPALVGLGAPPVATASAAPALTDPGAAPAGYRVQAGEAALYVEAVDLADGARVAIVKADAAGRYRIPFDRPGPRALAIQATTLAGSKVTGFLAAPLSQPATGAAALDVTPGTTAIALACARLAGVGPELVADKGFRGFKAAALPDLVARLDAPTTGGAAAVLDPSRSFAQAESFDAILAAAVRGGTALAQSALEKAGSDAASQSAALRLILAAAAGVRTGTAARPQDILTTAALAVSRRDVAEALSPGPTPAPR
ncbi:MAG: hypothetical protein FJZ01_16395 [Candidatus Sericytochromatia bacterium]|nr:hypothetical protein [Candidatus Tanganyikabacteria bacterium]